MTTYTVTSERVQLGKKSYTISSKMTKKGIRFFYYALGRYYPISRAKINENII